jgi:ABC-type branched-subunit amino acid transport system substrate-binding protein
MKNKILFISLAVVLVLSVGLIGCGGAEEPRIPETQTQIVIGVSSPLDGPLAPIRASALTPILDTYLYQVNNVSGGMLLKQYGATYRVPVVVLEYNDSSDVETMLENTEKLITQDKVDFMFGACGTAMISAQAPLVNSLDYVLMTFEGGATTMKETLPGMPYVFVNLNFSDWYQMPILAQMLEAKGATTAYVVWINDLHGIEYNGIANEQFNAHNITVVKSVSISWIPAEAVAAAPGIVADAKSMNPDVFCMFGYTDQVIALTTQAIAQDFNPKAMIGGPGANFGFFAFALSDPPNPMLTEGIMCFTTANNKTSTDMAWLFDEILLPAVGFAYMDWWGAPLYWAAMEMWQAAVEKVGYVNQEDVRDALTSFNSSSNSVDTVLGDTWYTLFGSGGGIMAYECHTGEIGQWQNVLVETVGPVDAGQTVTGLPNYVVTANFTYPKPAWP